MKHFGDITKLSGYDLPVVDCITGGSPCQDLSVAGKRAGLDGERSGLFMEQVRIVKEMRERDRTTGRTGWLIRPRFMVWENVPGAFSSNGGRDFQAVLSEIVKIADPDAPDVPMPDNGKWPKSGCISEKMGGWSVAWRVHDAQFWGVPQRRKRIALVADFGGLSAPEVLFERKGLSGDFEPSGTEREETAGTVGGGTKNAISFQERAGKPGGGKGILIQHEHVGALSTLNNQSVLQIGCDVYNQEITGGVAAGNGDGDTVPTLTGDHQNRVTDYTAVVLPFDTTQVTSPVNRSRPNYGDPCHPLAAGAHPPAVAIGNDKLNQMSMAEQANTLDTMHDQQAVMVPDVAHSLKAKANCDFRENSETYPVQRNIVRRLTPLECERLQGFPSSKMVDVSKMTKDEYIAWNLAEGNIIADSKSGKVYGTRGPGGCPYNEPKELQGTDVNGYKVVSIRNGATKLQCRVHRIIWISVHGVIPDGYVIDHINNVKSDNRIDNLQLLTPSQNSNKARLDGLYKSGLDNKATKLDPDLKDEIAFLYEYSDLTMRQLAELYGVSKSRIGQIVHEVGWTDIGDWTDSKGKVHKAADSPRYKALGNSIALPFWFWLLRRISAQYERPATLGSLFDGIGGFPLCWEKCNGKGTAVWASEIEEFPIAVTKKHFPEEENNVHL